MVDGPQASIKRSIEILFGVGTVGGMTDGELLERFLARRVELAEAAFAALVARHGPMVWSVCRGALSDAHAAEDAFQATFLVLVRRARSIRKRESVGPWLHGVARRVAVRTKRASTRLRSSQGQDTDMRETPPVDPVRRELVEALHQEVDRLPEKYRAPVVLCHLEGRTHTEAARLLQCPVGTVSVRLARARERLRLRLTRRGLALPSAGVIALLGASSASAMPTALATATIRNAAHLAAGTAMTAGMVPALVAQLVEGELRSMTLFKLTMVGSGVLAAGVVAAGAGWLTAIDQPAQANSIAVAASNDADPAPAAAPAAPDDADAADKAARRESMDSLKSLGLAMHNYAASHDGRFPPAAIRKGGKSLLSWRVAILPYLDQKALYEKFHLDEPWDSPHNKELLKEMPDIYAPVAKEDQSQDSTHYQVFVGPGALFGRPNGTRLADVHDGLGLTILVAEAADPVPWTKPEDLPFDPDKPLPKLGGQLKDGFNVAFADGSVRFLSQSNPPEILATFITRDGGEAIDASKLRP